MIQRVTATTGRRSNEHDTVGEQHAAQGVGATAAGSRSKRQQVDELER